jgi:mRNA interferase MazF
MFWGEIWWANMPDPIDSGPGYRRPVLIVQADEFTQSRLRTVIVVVLTGNLPLAQLPGNVELPAAKTGLPKDSVANVTQIVTLAKSLLTEKVGQIDDTLIFLVEEGIRQVLYL